MRAKILFVGLALVVAVPAAAQKDGPSFDCKKAATAIQKSICKNQDLARLDQMVARYYRTFLTALPPESKFQKDLRATQRTWLKHRNKVCGRAATSDKRYACLYQFYQGRIVGLARLFHNVRGGRPNRGVPFISGWYAARQPGISVQMLLLEWPDEHVSGHILTVRTNWRGHTCTLDMPKMVRAANTLTFVSRDEGSKNCTLSVRVDGTQAQVKAAPCWRQYWCGMAGFMSGRYVRTK